MRAKIKKNEAYSKLMLDEGSQTRSDEDTDFKMELPSWADEKKIKMGQNFVLLNLNAMSRALFICLTTVGSIPSILKILSFTKQSSSPALAYRRFRMNAKHAQLWYTNKFEEGSKAWKSIEIVRRMHVVVSKRTERAGLGIISQKDMALTQFLFMGYQVLRPEEFGFVASREQFEAFSHLWRVIGFMLGIEDRFNCCGETLEETRSRLEAMRVDMFLPELMKPSPEYDDFFKTTAYGMWYGDPTINYETAMFCTMRMAGVPGYHIYESEAIGSSKKVLNELSYYIQFRIFLDVLVFEILSHYFVFRWIFNITRILFNLLNINETLARLKFGEKYVNVPIAKLK